MANPFLALMTQSATLERKTSVDSYGQNTFAAPTTIACRWVKKPERVRTTSGDDVLASDVFWCPPDTGLHVEDQCTSPDGRVVTVIIVERAPDYTGAVYADKGWCL